MDEQETFDNWHIVTLVNRSRSSSFVDNFVISLFFSLFWICCFICGFRFQPRQKNLDSFVSTKFKMYQNPFCSKKSTVSFQMNQLPILLEKELLIHVIINQNLEKKRKETMKRYLEKCFETWFDKTNCCIDENYLMKNTIVKAIWWKKQSTPWSKLYTELLCFNAWTIWNQAFQLLPIHPQSQRHDDYFGLK